MNQVLSVNCVLDPLPTHSNAEEELAVTLISSTNQEFAKSLYEVVRHESGNLVISPLSIQTMMTILWLGSNGSTEEQLEDGMHIIHGGQDHVLLGTKIVLNALRKTPQATVDIGNRFYIQRDLSIMDDFQEMMMNTFSCEVQAEDFSERPEKAIHDINMWMSNRTRGNFAGFVDEETFTSSTHLIGVSTLYFKANWFKPFDDELTTNENFNVNASYAVDVSMMHQQGQFLYGNETGVGFEAIELVHNTLNYTSNDEEPSLRVMILLPHGKHKLSNVETYITAGHLNEFRNEMEEHEVEVSLPKFNTTGVLTLVPALAQIGIYDVFKDKADLSGLSKDNVHVNKVIHKAVVELTDYGSEFSSVLTKDMRPERKTPGVIEFYADHPFLFIISDENQKVILAMGRVLIPQS